MKKYLFKISIFVLLFILSNFLFLKLVQHFDWNFSKLMHIDGFEDKQFDCLILGNSLAFDAFDMTQFEELGISAYNFAVDGASLKSNVLQLEKFLIKNKPPKMIILGLSSYRNTNFNSKTVHPILDYLYGRSDFSYKNLPMIKFKWMAPELLKKLISKEHRNAKVYKGQLRTKKIIADETVTPNKLQTNIDYSRYESAIYLARIDSICLKHKIKQINIEMPSFYDRQNAIPIGPINYKNKNGIKRSFYNLNNSDFCKIFDPSKDWLGDSHLNIYGSQKFTKYLFDHKIVSY